MSYLEDYKRAKDSGRLERLTYSIQQWKEEGQLVIGRLVGHSLFEGGKFDTPVNQYMLQTDEGLITCILGTATDAQIGDNVDIGDLLAIHYLGKRELDDGRKVNIFNVDIIEPVEGKGLPPKKGHKKGSKDGK